MSRRKLEVYFAVGSLLRVRPSWSPVKAEQNAISSTYTGLWPNKTGQVTWVVEQSGQPLVCQMAFDGVDKHGTALSAAVAKALLAAELRKLLLSADVEII